MYNTQNQSNEKEPRLEVQKVNSILLVEDDLMVSSLIKSALNKSGYMVYPVYHKDEMIEEIAKTLPDVIVLDLGCSGANGFQLCEEARRVFKGPIIVLTARANEEEQVLAFNLGVDDYIIKPVSHNILRVRIQSLLRRQPQQNELEVRHHFNEGDIDLYPQANKCFIKGEPITLSSFEFKLLALLMRNEGRVMSRDSIYNVLLGREYNGVERTVDVRISKLRDKLTSKGMVQPQIETVWGIGYILNGGKVHQ